MILGGVRKERLHVTQREYNYLCKLRPMKTRQANEEFLETDVAILTALFTCSQYPVRSNKVGIFVLATNYFYLVDVQIVRTKY